MIVRGLLGSDIQVRLIAIHSRRSVLKLVRERRTGARVFTNLAFKQDINVEDVNLVRIAAELPDLRLLGDETEQRRLEQRRTVSLQIPFQLSLLPKVVKKKDSFEAVIQPKWRKSLDENIAKATKSKKLKNAALLTLLEDERCAEILCMHACNIACNTAGTSERNLSYQLLDNFSLKQSDAETRREISNVLLDLIKDSCLITNEDGKDVRAFYSIYDEDKKKCWKPSKDFTNAEWYKRTTRLHLSVKKMPMLCPPRHWINAKTGGRLELSDFMVTSSKPDHVEFLTKEYGNSNLENNLVCKGLNALGSTPWEINEKVLQIALKVYSDPVKKYSSFSSLKRKEFCNEFHLRQKLIMANDLKGKVFWNPYRIDFRGRAYAASCLNHMGDDFSKSLFLFGEKKPLGERGLDCLFRYFAGLWSVNRCATMEKRIEYGRENLNEILNFARSPLDHEWWDNNDDRWQLLAVCFEICEALNSNNCGKHAESFVSGFPVQQDATCNGMQHYAALSRDPIAAHLVNLTRTDVPQDLYTHINDKLEQQRKKDAKSGNKIASILEGFLPRKLVKQIVMTVPYGLSPLSAINDLYRALKEVEGWCSSDHDTKLAAIYVQRETFKILKKNCQQFYHVRCWLKRFAQFVAEELNQPMKWISPIQLHICQPGTPNKGTADFVAEQTWPFPANYIHSLDASHMFFTALECERGIPFAAIHDCFWSLPSDAVDVKQVCRNEFIKMHSQALLQNLAQYYLVQNDTKISPEFHKFLMDFPKQGSFDLNQMKDSEFFIR